MNIAELKLDLFRKIDNLNESEIKKIYHKFLAILNSASLYKLSHNETKAIHDALKASKNGEIYTHDEVMEEARRKYPNLKFR